MGYHYDAAECRAKATKHGAENLSCVRNSTENWALEVTFSLMPELD